MGAGEGGAEAQGAGAHAALLSALVEGGLAKVIHAQRLQSHSDQELLDSMEWLTEKVERGVENETSSFEK